jgi:hypothetical protein
MQTRIVLLIALLTPLRATIASDDGYSCTVAEARAAVRELYRTECEEVKSKPRLPYRETFEKAMRGDVKALYTVFTDENYHSGDNEGWISTAWPLVLVVGDKHFAAFLETLDPKMQRDIFDTIFCGSYSRALKNGYFERKFPRVAAIYKRLHPPNASNQSMKPTAPFRCNFSELATTPCVGLSLSS